MEKKILQQSKKSIKNVHTLKVLVYFSHLKSVYV